jgi:uncharacterized lipoprotein YbaY
MINNRKPLLRGGIVFIEKINSFANATIYVRLEDVTLIDAPSKVILEQVINNVYYDQADQDKIEFVIYGEIINKQARYSISVHIDVDRDSKLSSGDFVNTESFIILPYGHTDNVSIRVRQLK